MQSTVLLVAALVAVWVGWRLYSRHALFPCPAEFSWLVEVENPLARATRSEAVVRQLEVRSGACVLDIGCGPGRVTLPLARAVGPQGQVIALDIQPQMLAKVREKADRENLANVQVMQWHANHAAFEPATLDAAVMVMTLGEIPEPERALVGVNSALKRGGRLLVAESVFDPHYVRRRRLREIALGAGLQEIRHSGNFFGYSVVFEKVKEGSTGIGK